MDISKLTCVANTVKTLTSAFPPSYIRRQHSVDLLLTQVLRYVVLEDV